MELEVIIIFLLIITSTYIDSYYGLKSFNCPIVFLFSRAQRG